MKYVVHYYDAQAKLAYSDMNAPSLEDAKSLAEGAIAQGTAARAEVRDSDGNLVFHCPRTLRAPDGS